MDKITPTLKDSFPKSQRLSISQRNSAWPHPTPAKVEKIYQTSGHLEWKTFIPLLEGKAEAGSSGREGKVRGHAGFCEQSCRGQGPGPGHWLSSRRKVVVGHAQRGQEHQYSLISVAVLVQALHQVVNAALPHLLRGPR